MFGSLCCLRPVVIGQCNYKTSGLETCDSHNVVLTDARNYSFLQVPYLGHEAKEN